MKIQIIPKLLFVSFLFLLVDCSFPAREPVPTGLMTDLLLHPEEAVITNSAPKFSWIVNGKGSGVMQTAYQILVATDKKTLENGDFDVWDSGKVYSDASIAVPYRGDSLDENSSYWWKVRTWDQNGKASPYSVMQNFNTGKFSNVERNWPGESRMVALEANGQTDLVFENRHPIRYYQIKPASIVINSAGNHFVSFEKAAFGTLELILNAPGKADSLIVHLGEKLAPGNRVDKNPGGSINYQRITLALQPDQNRYLLELPRHLPNYPNTQVLPESFPEVAAFRYAEIEGWPGTLEMDQVLQHALLYHFDETAADFISSNDNLNRIWDLCKHTLKVTPFLGLYIDGARERMPYEADSYIQQISHYSVDREYAVQRYTANFLIFNPSWPAEWHLHMVLMAWADYMATGDSRFLEEYYDELKKKTLLPLAREDGLISTRTGLVTEEFLKGIHYEGTSFRDIVDWPQGTPANEMKYRSGWRSITFEGETDRFVFSEINTVVNAFHYRNLVLMEKIAALLDKSEDERFFHERAALVKASFNEKLMDKDRGLYTDGEGVHHSSLHANMFPVAFGLAPKANYTRLREFLTAKGMACSPYGAPYLFDALYELGAEDYALRLLTSELSRSWMNMIYFGTTITSEAWDMKFKRNMTWNHAWGASPVYIITRKIFGIEPLEPAFRKILIKPRPGDLTRATLKSPTIRGPVNAQFHKEQDEEFHLDVTIPSNTYARVMLPDPGGDITLNMNGSDIPVDREDGSIVIDHLKAGKYLFVVKPLR